MLQSILAVLYLFGFIANLSFYGWITPGNPRNLAAALVCGIAYLGLLIVKLK